MAAIVATSGESGESHGGYLACWIVRVKLAACELSR
jgi:hypothetical protein